MLVELSVVLPAYNEAESLPSLLDEIADALHHWRHEVIVVDDGSADESARVVESSGGARLVRLARRSGQSAALFAGFDAAVGRLIATLDADGQNDPKDLIPMLRMLESDDTLGAVVGYRVGRRDSAWKRLQGWIANRCRDLITGDKVTDTGCSIRVARADLLKQVSRFDGAHRFMPTLIRIAGGRVVEHPVGHRSRRYGVSKYNMRNRVFKALGDAFRVRKLRALSENNDGP